MVPSYDEREEREEREREVRVVISDKRHSRDVDAEADESADGQPEPAAPEPTPDEAAQLLAAEPQQPAESSTQAASADGALLDFPQTAPAPPVSDAAAAVDEWDLAAESAEALDAGGQPPLSEEEQAAAAMEMAQLRQVFAGGLSRYLQAQLGLLLNFALIGLGRQPDPATGILAPNLNQARLAIDVLEFLVARLDPELHPQDRVQLKQLVADLKYAFMQAVAPAAGGADGGMPSGGSA